MNIQFKKGMWEDKLDYVYTNRFPFAPKLIQEEDCIRNGVNEQMKDGFDYTSIILKEKYGAGTAFSATCSFENYGAPLFVFPHSVYCDEDGIMRYNHCHEVVLWEDGINVWDIYKDGEEMKITKISSLKFDVEANIPHSFSVKLMDKGFEITAGGRVLYIRVPELPSEVYAGFTLCEAINRLYDFSVE